MTWGRRRTILISPSTSSSSGCAGIRAEAEAQRRQALDLLAEVGLLEAAAQPAGKLPYGHQRRLEIVALYDEGLRDVPWIDLPVSDSPDSKSSWHIYAIQTDYRDELNTYLEKRGIGTGVHYRPIHMYSIYKDHPKLPGAEAKVITLLITVGRPNRPCGRKISTMASTEKAATSL